MRICFKKGQGLGNQLWVFSAAKSISEKFNFDLQIFDYENFKGKKFLKLDIEELNKYDSELPKEMYKDIFHEFLYYDSKYNYVLSGFDERVFNLKDNLAYSLYDLYVSINNAINEDDPSKLKLYISESSNDNMRTKQILRNQKILQLKEQAESEGGDNNIIVVPTDEGGKQTNLIDNTPTKKGGDKISFVPYEPVNIGEDILLYNLNE